MIDLLLLIMRQNMSIMEMQKRGQPTEAFEEQAAFTPIANEEEYAEFLKKMAEGDFRKSVVSDSVGFPLLIYFITAMIPYRFLSYNGMELTSLENLCDG